MDCLFLNVFSLRPEGFCCWYVQLPLTWKMYLLSTFNLMTKSCSTSKLILYGSECFFEILFLKTFHLHFLWSYFSVWTAHVVDSFDSAISLRAFWINSSSFSENKNRRINQIKSTWTTYSYSMNPPKARNTWVTDRHPMATKRKLILSFIICDLSSALFSYTQTSLFHLNGHTTLLHPKA